MGSTPQYTGALTAPIERALDKLAAALVVLLPMVQPHEPFLAAGNVRAAFLANDARTRTRALIRCLASLQAARAPSPETLRKFWLNLASQAVEDAAAERDDGATDEALNQRRLPWWARGFPVAETPPPSDSSLNPPSFEALASAALADPRPLAPEAEFEGRCHAAIRQVRGARSVLKTLEDRTTTSLEQGQVYEAFLADAAMFVRADLADELRRLRQWLAPNPDLLAGQWLYFAHDALAASRRPGAPAWPKGQKPWFLGPCPVDFSG